ncbi:MAG: ComF family protein [Acidobacteria bacterium]|nr:ComF family protein [Acidobacteriota bacterium]
MRYTFLMLDLIIKPRCAHCKSTDNVRFGLCSSCLNTLTAYSPPARCKVCGMAIRGEGNICQRCLEGRDRFDRAFFLFPYAGEGRTLIHHIKFRDCVKWLGILDAAESVWRPVLESWHPDAVTWIPSSLHTRWMRGYNVSGELAKQVAETLRIPCLPLLKRARLFKRRLSATGSPGERRRVIRQFLKGPESIPEGISRILLVDDVLTTGATVNRGAKLLKQAGGVSEVSVFTLSRVCE